MPADQAPCKRLVDLVHSFFHSASIWGPSCAGNPSGQVVDTGSSGGSWRSVGVRAVNGKGACSLLQGVSAVQRDKAREGLAEGWRRPLLLSRWCLDSALRSACSLGPPLPSAHGRGFQNPRWSHPCLPGAPSAAWPQRVHSQHKCTHCRKVAIGTGCQSVPKMGPPSRGSGLAVSREGDHSLQPSPVPLKVMSYSSQAPAFSHSR